MPDFEPAVIANQFVDRSYEYLSQLKLQKLTYLAHGWHLAIKGSPLVSGNIEAWDNGPVFRSVWNRIRDFGRDEEGHILNSEKKPFKAELEEFERELMDHVWERYGDYPAMRLSHMTHQPNTPWAQAYFEQGRNAIIGNDVTKEYFLKLANTPKQ